MLPYLLLIDDDADEYFLLTELIRSRYSGLRCMWCKNLCAATEAIRNEVPALVLVDYQLGIPDGIEVIAGLRRIQQLEKVSVVLYSSVLDDSLCEMAIASGASGCVRKSFSLQCSKELDIWLDAVYAQ